MKKAYLLLGAAGMLLASCSQEALEGPAVNGNGNTTITVQLPKSMGSRAVFGNGETATQLNVAVFDNVGEGNYTFLYDVEANFVDDEAIINLELVSSQKYTVAFFASAPENGIYTWNSNDATVTVNYGAMTSEGNLGDLYDCFSGVQTITGGVNDNVELTRPVAQICWGTTPLTAGSDQATIIQNTFGAQWQYLRTNFTASNINNQLNVLSGETSTVVVNDFEGSVSLDGFAAPYLQQFPAVGNGTAGAYTWIASQYVLVSNSAGTTDLELTINNSGVTTDNQTSPSASISYTLPVNSAPIQANYQTLIYGNLFTSNTELTVKKNAVWSTPENPVQIINGVPYITINANTANILNNGTGNYILSEDVDYSGGLLEFTNDINIDLNGNSLTSAGGTYGDAIKVQGADVTISNGTITSSPTASAANASASIIVQGSGNPASHLVLNDVTITDAPGYPILMTSQNPETTIVINSGTYSSTSNNGPAVRVGSNATATSAGKVTIYGGTFGKAGVNNKYVLNVLDNLSKGKDPRQYIEVFGGTFINFNPAANTAEGNPTNFVAEGYQVVSEPKGTDTYYTVIPSTTTVVSPTDLQEKVSTPNATLYLQAGDYTLPSNVATGVTFTGSKDAVFTINKTVVGGYDNVTFEGVAFDAGSYDGNPPSGYPAIQHSSNLTYNNCTFNGEFFNYAIGLTFNGCTFTQTNPSSYCQWTYTAENVKYENCNFNTAGKAILVYNETSSGTFDVTVEGCTFTSTNTTNPKAAVQINPSNKPTQPTFIVTIDDCTETGFASNSINGSALWGIKSDTVECIVSENGKVVYQNPAPEASN